MSFGMAEIEALAAALADSQGGLSHSDISNLLVQCSLPHAQRPMISKRVRLTEAFVHSHNSLKSDGGILKFVELAAKPARFINRRDDYEYFRESVNVALAFTGRVIGEDGRLVFVRKATTLPEAEQRARELRADLVRRGVHPVVLEFCRAELVADNYFHAVFEANKSIAKVLQRRTGLTDDGSVLFDHVFGVKPPLLIINSYKSKSEIAEQVGFCLLLKGVYGMFRNPAAHEAKIDWPMTKEDAEDFLTLVSLIHRRIDKATMPPRV